MYAASYIWAKVLNRIEQQLTEIMVTTWFDDAEVISFTDEALTIYSPSEFRQEHIRTSCAPYIEEALRELFHSNAKLIVWGETEMKEHREQKNQQNESYFNPQFILENFIAGTSNTIPLKIASAVAAAPGMDAYNPVFFYGPPGVGKTHLLYSIANAVAKQFPEKKIVCIKGDQFTNELVKAIQYGKTAEFRERYRQSDVLLVDDIQFIAGKESTQEEFFHTFNALYESGKQIVLTADRKPSDMATLEDRLRSRFGVGIIVAIKTPDYNTRVQITKAKAQRLDLDFDSETIKYIAANLTDNVRQIEGALKKIRAYRDLAGVELTLESVIQIIEDIRTSESSIMITPAAIVRNVCKYYGVDESTLRGPQRSRNISEPRQIAMYLMRQLVSMSQEEIAKEFSRERTTVIHALKQIEKELQLKDNKLDPIIQDLHSNIVSCL